MKTIALLLTMVCGLLAAPESKEQTTPLMPEEVTLTSGRVLRKVQVVRWDKDRVVLKHTGGAEPIPFSMISSITLADLNKMRAAGKITEQARPAPAAAKTFTVEGQVLDRGVDQPYKFVGLVIGIYPSGQEFPKPTLFNLNDPLPKNLGETMTDIDGKFTLNAPAENAILYARAIRSYRVGTRAVYEWNIPITGDAKLVLSGSNAKITPVSRDM